MGESAGNIKHLLVGVLTTVLVEEQLLFTKLYF